ncbi:G patch domain and ankyrin repeat-containing protein 1 [Synchiropus splendidus]|uniref:G patch domain and ankyrin repeat-containing protein 1 n=1 Tax=Synchiropus splendidus TaxID=270530 RepID=UPI00237DBF09|nr:G patch domain and ankyrin repeat-containing protein 1 [Synchiropus splendidus]
MTSTLRGRRLTPGCSYSDSPEEAPLVTASVSGMGFTPARDSDVFSGRSSDGAGPGPGVSLSGTEARHFYESLLQDGEQGRNQRPERRVSPRARVPPAGSQPAQRSESSAELMGLRFLRRAQEGDLPALRDLISRGVDINFQDSFFWTALMCSSWAGRRAAVRLLLRSGAAWVGVVDVRGRDARDLAAAAGHGQVLEELDSFGPGEEAEPGEEAGPVVHSSAAATRWCHTCGVGFSGSAHLSSTLHQFSLRRPQPAPHYCLPPSANSFRMMLRCGWRPGSGLGRQGDGPCRPLATVLKRDQAGLGYGPARKPRVTHFRARDPRAVGAGQVGEEPTGRGLRREEERRRRLREQSWERDFRTSFYL